PSVRRWSAANLTVRVRKAVARSPHQYPVSGAVAGHLPSSPLTVESPAGVTRCDRRYPARRRTPSLTAHAPAASSPPADQAQFLDRAPVELPQRARLEILGAVMVGIFLAALDQTVVGTALPRIVTELRGNDLYTWVFTA